MAPASKASTFGWQASIARDLDGLAAVAWCLRGAPRDTKFLLDPRCLPAPTATKNVERALELFYQHARDYAAGFEVPFRVPKVRFSAARADETPGQYRVDEDGYVSIEISPALLRHPESVLAVLAHEACHHILDLSGLNTHRSEVDEPLTDLAMFICGFGKVFVDGKSYLSSIKNQWCSTHLGYLTEEQYKFAYSWVLRSCAYATPGADTSQRDGHDSRYHRSKLLNRLGGNALALERLLERERRRHPEYDELSLYAAISEQVERDKG